MIDSCYDANDHTKEVYAHFGLAYYESGCLESGLAIGLLVADFLAGWKRKLDRDGKARFDRKVYETEFDRFLKDQHQQTLGNLIKRLNNKIVVPSELKGRLDRAKTMRDILAHHYFRDRATDFVKRSGRDRMIVELTEMQETFRTLDKAVQELIEPLRRNVGMTDATMKKFMDAFAQEAYRE